jgi:hypothetical protein
MTGTALLFDLGDLRHKWGWFLALGIIMIVFGLIALAVMPAATIGTVLILGWLMIFSGIVEAIHGFQVRELGRIFLAPAGRHCGGAHRVARGHSSRCWRARLDTSVRVILHGYRPIPLGCGDQAEVPQLGLGGLRWRDYAAARNPALGRLAVVWILVSRSVSRNCVAAARLVARDARPGSSQLAGSAEWVAPRRLRTSLRRLTSLRTLHSLQPQCGEPSLRALFRARPQ